MVRPFSSLIIIAALCVLPTAALAGPGTPQLVKEGVEAFTRLGLVLMFQRNV